MKHTIETRRTRQRSAIRAVMQAAGRPLSPAEVLAHAKRAVPTLGLATIYRALKALMADGDVIAVALPGEPPRYEVGPSHHHHHFQCRRCRRVFEVPGCPGNVARLAPAGFRVDAHELVLYGRCRQCAA
jgi:Fur family transcriptional regulator, ferric uptake regulator